MSEIKQGGKRPGAGRPPKLPAEKVRQLTITVKPEVFEALLPGEIREAALRGIDQKMKENEVV